MSADEMTTVPIVEGETDITVNRQHYFEIRLRSATLGLLEAGGVDNWNGYEDALWPWYNGDDIETIENRLKEEIFGY